MQPNRITILSVMLCFFTMGFVDLVGIASNYVKADLNLNDATANIFPSLVFFWFLIFSVPTGVLMNKIGRKNTVLISIIITLFALALPLFGETFYTMLIAFSLLGIGNTLMQVSVNPLVTCVMSGGNLAATLTLGQFVKALSSFSAPYLAMWGATLAIPSFGLNWRILFAIFLVVGAVSALVLFLTRIGEPQSNAQQNSTTVQFKEAFKLLVPKDRGRTTILLTFFGIMCHVGIDVGTNTTAPKILIERTGMDLNSAAFATSLYFIFRTLGCFSGTFLLRIFKARAFFLISVLCMLCSMAGLAFGASKTILYTAIALVGYGNSNIFPICFANALQAAPQKQNEVSGLMIMGLFGGTVFPLAMGIASDAFGQVGAVFCMALGVVYLLSYILKAK